jgi:flagellar hook-length control protein FliK
MSIASNPLLQLTAVAQTPVSGVGAAAKAADAGNDKADSFADLYAKHNQAQSAKAAGSSARSANKAAVADHAASAAKAKPAADKPALAEGGKSLPAKRAVADARVDAKADARTANRADRTDARENAQEVAQAKSDGTDRASEVDQQADDDSLALAQAEQDEPLASAASVDDDAEDAADSAVVNDPGATLLADLKAAPQPDASQAVTSAPDPSTLAQNPLDPALVASLMPGSISAPPPPPGERPARSDSDPAPDALADLPAVRMALEQSARAQGTTSAHAQAAVDPLQTPNGADSSFVNGLAAQLGQQQTSDAGAASVLADKDFQAVLGDNAKQAKEISADARVDNFANRLQGLAEVITPRAVAATPQATPLAMNQGGWSESLVNRVMYLSSQNLKSADIQLSPAELGKLDIRVDMGPDQQTQVTFVSAHIGVRDALESQQGRLKELFAQQGLGQMDVNVSDQSRNQQGQQQQAQQASRGGSGGGGRVGRDSGDGGDAMPNAVESVAPSVVIGSSAVDYYA